MRDPRPPFPQDDFNELLNDLVLVGYDRVYGFEGGSVRQQAAFETTRAHLELLVDAAGRLAFLGQEPTSALLAQESGLTKRQVDWFLRRRDIASLPAAVMCAGIEATVLQEPQSIYFKSWVEPATAPDKFGALHPAVPNIHAAVSLPGKRGSRNAPGATSHAYAIGFCGKQPVVCGDTQLVQGWWDPEQWRKYPERVRAEMRTIKAELGAHAGLAPPYEPITTPAQITTDLAEQIVRVRDGFDWRSVGLYRPAIQSGWIRSGSDEGGGHGSELRFIGGDLESLEYLDRRELVPLLDLPQSAHAMSRRDDSHVRWDLDWQFDVGDQRIDGKALQEDLLRRVDGRPQPRWWKAPDDVISITLDLTSCRYHLLRCRARAIGGSWKWISLLVRRDYRNRWSGWVTTDDLEDREVQARLIREAELDVARHSPDGPLERTMQALLHDGFAQRNKHRKWAERRTFGALAITVRTLLDVIGGGPR